MFGDIEGRIVDYYRLSSFYWPGHSSKEEKDEGADYEGLND